MFQYLLVCGRETKVQNADMRVIISQAFNYLFVSLGEFALVSRLFNINKYHGMIVYEGENAMLTYFN